MKYGGKEIFRDTVQRELHAFFEGQQAIQEKGARPLKVDLHCHDLNSNIPGERLGRILSIRETWLPTDDLVACLEKNNSDILTITNHNNARSCWELQDKGVEILPGAEFTCRLPKSRLEIHVLAYGFNPEQEERLNLLRNNLYSFLSYCRERGIETVWAHPLYFNGNYTQQTINNLEHIVTLFSNFEVINGQRSSWQNLMTVRWLQSFNDEKVKRVIDSNEVKPFDMNPDPSIVNMVGGSDDHMGIFAGTTGTYLILGSDECDGLSGPECVMKALREGRTSPFGFYTEETKMTVSFLELFYMLVENMNDPGMIRMLLHKGTKQEKIIAFAVSNMIPELRRHKFTSSFLRYFHNSLHGRSPGFWRRFIKDSAKPLLGEIDKISAASSGSTGEFLRQTRESLQELFFSLNRTIFTRAESNMLALAENHSFDKLSLNEILEKLELPSVLRTLFGNESDGGMRGIDVGKVFDKLTFPAIASVILGGSNFVSAHVMHSNREFLNYFAEETGALRHPVKALWLTDTFDDKNGIALTLRNYYEEISRHDLAVDILVCSDTVKPREHLKVVRPVGEFPAPVYKDQALRIPDLMQIHEIFKSGGYDRVLCSTEVPMGLAGLYLKKAFNVPAYFFMHTDWIEFAKQTLKLPADNLKRLTRILRALYRSYDKIFVLNNDHRDWLTGRKISIKPEKIVNIKHWIDPVFVPCKKEKPVPENQGPLLLYVGRLSEEKGVIDCIDIFKKVETEIPACRLLFVGEGPAEASIKKLLPDAEIIPWVEQEQLPSVYCSADLLLFPSKFDTFGRVVLEALSCGLPVAAYDKKGPADIIGDSRCGILKSSSRLLASGIIEILKDRKRLEAMKAEALVRAGGFRKEPIFRHFINKIGLNEWQ